MSAATILSQAYGENACLYETVLNVPRDATASQLRKAYYKKALKYHPDKLDGNLSPEEREAAKIKFQAISLAYTILSDDEKRAEYDESGDLYDDDDDLSSSKSGMKQWTDYFRNIFPTVTTADIDAFEVKYKCSDEEESDVLKYYSQFKGDLNKMLECVMLSSDVDKERWVKDYINPAIERGDVNDFSDKLKKTLSSAPAKKKKSKGGKSKSSKMEVEEDEMSDDDAPAAEIVDDDDEMVDAEHQDSNSQTKKSKGKGSNSKTSPKKKTTAKKASAPGNTKSKSKNSTDDDLIAQIRGKALARRQEGFDSMMAGLEDRYGGKKKGKGKKADDDIPDDEFEKIQAKIMKNRRKK
jgi:DnaJ family protein C protein 9